MSRRKLWLLILLKPLILSIVADGFPISGSEERVSPSSSLSDLGVGQAANSKTACRFRMKPGIRTFVALQKADE